MKCNCLALSILFFLSCSNSTESIDDVPPAMELHDSDIAKLELKEELKTQNENTSVARPTENYGYRKKAIEDIYFGVPYNDSYKGKTVSLNNNSYRVSIGVFDFDDYYGLYKLSMYSNDRYYSLSGLNEEVENLSRIITANYPYSDVINEDVPLVPDNTDRILYEARLKRPVVLPKPTMVLTKIFYSAENEIKIGYLEKYESEIVERFGNEPEIVSKRYYNIILDLKSRVLGDLIQQSKNIYRDSILKKDSEKF